MKHPLKLIAFDLDGTLVDAHQAVTDSVNHTLRQLGHKEVDHLAVQQRIGWGEQTLIDSFVEPDQVEQALEIYRQHHVKALQSGVTFLSQALETIQSLKERDFQLAIASNRPSLYTHIILKQMGLEGYFDFVVCADQVEKGKPAGDLLREIMHLATLGREEMIYVGDLTIDVQAGHDAGVKTIAVTTGSHSLEEISLHRPHKTISSLDALLSILENWPALVE